MKITSFNPMILTSHQEDVISLFEALGFEKHHNPTGTSGIGTQFTGVRMKDANGFCLDIVQSTKLREVDEFSIRMNVDDFDAACKLLTDHGFKSLSGDRITDTGSAKADMLGSPSGFTISLIQHIK